MYHAARDTFLRMSDGPDAVADCGRLHAGEAAEMDSAPVCAHEMLVDREARAVIRADLSNLKGELILRLIVLRPPVFVPQSTLK